MTVPNDKDQLPLFRRTLREYGESIGMEPHMLRKLEVALEEAVVNIINYSHATQIGMDISHTGTSAVSILLTDDGVPFDPTSFDSDTSRAVSERQIGGLGISLMHQISDELHYRRINGNNQLELIKYL